MEKSTVMQSDSQGNGKKRKKEKNKKIVRVRFQICLACVIMVVATVCASYLVLVRNSNAVIKKKAGALTASLNAQICLGVDNFLENIENSCLMIYSDPENYEFDAVKEKNEMLRAQTEERISGRLSYIEVLGNYVDLGIIYRNGESAGRIGRTESEEELFTELEDVVAGNPDRGHWYTGIGNDFQKFAYVKRLNENAILYASFYTQELKRMIESAVSVDKRIVYIVDEKWDVICSEGEIGEDIETLWEEARNLLQGENNAEIFDNSQVFAVNQCKSQWRVVSAVDVKDMLKENNEIIVLFLLVFVTVLVGSVISALLSRSITKPLNTMVEGLSERADSDLLTGNLNKKPFEQAVEKALQEEQYGEAMVLILTDVDDFKHINDSYGHISGDKVLAQYGSILSEVFREEIVGRIGGDEFAVLVKIPRYERERQYIIKKVEELCRRVEDIKVEDTQVTISIGAAVRQYSEGDFKQLYRNADTALYQTKMRGKNGYTIYEET